MLFNPAASYDLGSYASLAGWGDEDLQRVSDVHFDQETMDYAAARVQAEYEAWLDGQIESACDFPDVFN